ncbi:MAG: NIPSNAP protein [Chloroflexi bacterium]|nr:MAG: NIPSNAP protein [Chloroflexota bacterium]
MFFELRQYRIRPGQQAAWVALMEAEIIPFQTAQGMDIRGSWVGEDDETQYFWMRAFESETERERLYEAVYQSDTWKNIIGPKIPDLMDREGIIVTRIVPTPQSGIK